MTALEFPHIRAGHICPLCNGAKDQHLITCWPCYRAHDLRHPNPHADARIADFEQALAGLAQRKAAERLRPAAPQAACDVGLFGDAHNQIDLIDLAQRKRVRK